jgi:hypothetical protein
MVTINNGLLALFLMLLFGAFVVWTVARSVRQAIAREIAQDIREEFPPSDIPAYIEREFGGWR